MTKFEKNVIKSIGGKKVQIVIYMLEHTNNENIFFGTYTEIAKANEATIKTVQTVIKQLIEEKQIVKLRNAAYKFNIEKKKKITKKEE